ncbi:hypothetical protein ID866_3877 [Astraeus odoratus]|nr:hypothetical protein ID866_3877 [Astraeus odoratus]
MSLFPRLPGGGRYFNSAKPPKPVVPAGRANVDSTSGAVTPAESNSSSKNDNLKASGDDEPSTQSLSSSTNPSDTSPSVPRSVPSSSPSPSPFRGDVQITSHPSVTAKEFKLHQFFSLHRPLLLLSQPPSTIFETVDPSVSLFPTSSSQLNPHSASLTTIDDPPESSPEADVDAARLLAHTLVVNRVGATMAWQDALSRLGLIKESTVSDLTLAKESAQEWVSIHADSTRRKKRKKMKKHKLKKRRRLSRAARQNAK